MPDPADYNDEDSWMEACVPVVMDEGKDHEEAVGQCLGMWRNKGYAVARGLVRNVETMRVNPKDLVYVAHDENVPNVARAYSVLTIKQVDNDHREIEGIATTPEVDRIGDVVEPMGAKFTIPMPLLWQHKHDKPVGHVVAAKANKEGISIRARLAKIDEPGELKNLLDLAWQSVKAGLVRGLSIGFAPSREDTELMESGGLRFNSWNWYELSLVTIPANAGATISVIKTMDRGLAEAQRKYEPAIAEAQAAAANAIQSRNVVSLPMSSALKYSRTPVRKVKQDYMTQSEILALERTGAKIYTKQWSAVLYKGGEPLYVVSYSD